MLQNLLSMASEQSFSIALLLAIAYVLWRTMRADMLKKDQRYNALEERFHNLEIEFRECIQRHQGESQRILLEQQRKNEFLMDQFREIMQHNTEVLEQNNTLLKQLTPLAKNFAR